MTEGNPELNELKVLVDKACDGLIEHCDTVQIFITKHAGDEQNTLSYEHGRGNFYARFGYVHEWLSIQDQYQRNEAIRRDKQTG